MAYTIGLGPIARKGVEVQLLSWALKRSSQRWSWNFSARVGSRRVLQKAFHSLQPTAD